MAPDRIVVHIYIERSCNMETEASQNLFRYLFFF